MARVKRKASTFPAEFGHLLYKVGTDREPVVVNNLPKNDKSTYTTLVARVHEFRRAFHNEALASGDPERMKVADLYYSVTVHNPEKIDGWWQVRVEPKDSGFANALGQLLGTGVGPRPKQASTAMQGAIDDYLKGDDQ